jgi:hypothetical protein
MEREIEDFVEDELPPEAGVGGSSHGHQKIRILGQVHCVVDATRHRVFAPSSPPPWPPGATPTNAAVAQTVEMRAQRANTNARE